MFGSFGSQQFGAPIYIPSAAPPVTGRKIACLGDSSSHGGSIITSGQDGTLLVGGIQVAVNAALHTCPITGHGITPVVSVTIKSFHNGKLILTEGAISGCGAIIIAPERKVYVE